MSMNEEKYTKVFVKLHVKAVQIFWNFTIIQVVKYEYQNHH